MNNINGKHLSLTICRTLLSSLWCLFSSQLLYEVGATFQTKRKTERLNNMPKHTKRVVNSTASGQTRGMGEESLCSQKAYRSSEERRAQKAEEITSAKASRHSAMVCSDTSNNK